MKEYRYFWLLEHDSKSSSTFPRITASDLRNKDLLQLALLIDEVWHHGVFHETLGRTQLGVHLHQARAPVNSSCRQYDRVILDE